MPIIIAILAVFAIPGVVMSALFAYAVACDVLKWDRVRKRGLGLLVPPFLYPFNASMTAHDWNRLLMWVGYSVHVSGTGTPHITRSNVPTEASVAVLWVGFPGSRRWRDWTGRTPKLGPAAEV